MIRFTRARLSAGLFLLLAISGCAILPQTQALRDNPPTGIPPRVELPEVPFFPQEDYQCGPASLAMALNAAGVRVTPDALVDQVYLPGRKGSLQVEMLAATRRRGLVAYELAPNLEDLLREVAGGTPVVVLENLAFRWHPIWHYAVVIGYDLEGSDLILRSGLKRRVAMPVPLFEFTWKDADYWAMVAVPPDKVPVTATEQRFGTAVVAMEKTGQIKAAQIAYGAMLGRWPQSLIGSVGLGNTSYALGDLDRAEAAFRQASLEHPESAIALNNLAQTLADRGKFAEALEAVQKAVNLGGPLEAATRATLEDIQKRQPASASGAPR